MNGSIILDTNVAVAFLSGDRTVQKQVAESVGIILTTIVLGELYYGAYQSARLKENLQRIDEFADGAEVLDVTRQTAAYFGMIKTELQRKGTPIPNNDIWIAALTKQHDAELATRDKHFDHVEDLRIVRW